MKKCHFESIAIMYFFSKTEEMLFSARPVLIRFQLGAYPLVQQMSQERNGKIKQYMFQLKLRCSERLLQRVQVVCQLARLVKGEGSGEQEMALIPPNNYQ